jgi:hypothetical protein
VVRSAVGVGRTGIGGSDGSEVEGSGRGVLVGLGRVGVRLSRRCATQISISGRWTAVRAPSRRCSRSPSLSTARSAARTSGQLGQPDNNL